MTGVDPAASGLRELKKRLTRERLIESALDLFAERGYEEATLAEIAARAGVSVRTLSNYFPSKCDLLVAYREDMLAVVERTLAARGALPPLDRLRAALVAVARENQRAPQGRLAQRLLARHATNRAVQGLLDRFRRVVRDLVEEAGPGPAVDRELAALALAAGHLAVIQSWATGEPGSLERRVDRLVAQWRPGVEDPRC